MQNGLAWIDDQSWEIPKFKEKTGVPQSQESSGATKQPRDGEPLLKVTESARALAICQKYLMLKTL